MFGMIIKGLWETLYMTLFSTFLAYLFGMLIGIVLVVTDKGGLFPVAALNKTLGLIVNLARSVPFLILLIAILPFTRLVVGTTIGPTAMVVPLVVASTPFIARLVESSLKEVDSGVIEAASSMGASPLQIIYKVLLPEARPSLILGAAISTITILSYSAMAGIVGGRGLGDLAIRYGYYRYQSDIMLITVAILVIIVQILQEVGARLARFLDKRLK
ncbi:MAG: ABC transporter permease [Oscillospiraceae bacterium]|jgi:D-methionine transport system permease protein|nr:ABC transporter permease [Oscillospiraceae bacterium]